MVLAGSNFWFKVQSKIKSYERIKTDKERQIERFRLECIGPIFTCICCMRDLFRRSTAELKADVEHVILTKNQMNKYLNFDESLKNNDEYEGLCKKDRKTKVNKKVREGYSLCKTCISYLKNKKMPPMCFENSLQPFVIPECLQNLSDIEKQLIVKNLIFIKIRHLPKTRMQAINDRVINIPIKGAYDGLFQIITSVSPRPPPSRLIRIKVKLTFY